MNDNMNNGNYGLIDFHSHILPNIDDGSSSIDESLEMIEIANNNKIDFIVATPHFYTNNNSNYFIEMRNKSVSELKACVNKSLHTKIFVGAEIEFFHGIGQSNSLSDLCICGTNVALVEMPFTRWNSNVVSEITNMHRNISVMPVIAHFERYTDCDCLKYIDNFVQNDVVIQINSEFLMGKPKKLMNKIIKSGVKFVIGSDCHNTTLRPENTFKGYEYILNHFGKSVVDRVNITAENLLSDAQSII